MSETTRRRLMIELRSTENVVSIAAAARLKGSFELKWLSLTDLPGFDSDSQFPPTEIPRVPRSADGRMLDFTLGPPVAGPEEPTYIIRGEIDEDRTNLLFERARRDDRIGGVFADPLVYGSITCPGDPPVGTDADVERLLCVQDLHERGLDGQGVLIAVVDTGFNLAYLNARGKTPGFDPGNCWVYQPGLTPGYMTLGHGTMCAFDTCIAAPRATLGRYRAAASRIADGAP